MIPVLIILTIFYLSVLYFLHTGVNRLRDGRNATEYSASVIIAARNEAAGIKACLDALLNQKYPSDRYEIIVVDDRSTDNTAAIVSQVATTNMQVRLIQITELSILMAPKKHALTTGIEASSGEIILITDADTIPSPGWIRGMIKQFEQEVGLVAGFAPLDRSKKQNLFFKLIRLDSLALAAVAAGSIGRGFPLTCTARSLGYRREVFNLVDGFHRIAKFISGDDDLFMHLVRDHTDWQIRYAIDPDATVSSAAVSDIHQFVNQRIRHASKGLAYSFLSKLMLSAIYLFNLMVMVMLIAGIWRQSFLITGAVVFFVKAVAEYLLLSQFSSRMKVQHYLRYFPAAMFLHIPYVVIFGLMGQLGSFHWKGKRFSTKL